MRPAFHRPYAIAMWDFSWLERRWPGAGYENWDTALSQLVERGYDAVRIDAYPHLLSADPMKAWDLLPAWDQTSWGAQSPVTVRVLPALLEFLRAARRHGVGVALSTWYRQDREDTRMNIRTPDDQARIWRDTLRAIDDAGLLDTILYVDLCNEYPEPFWAPYLRAGDLGPNPSKTEPRLIEWMREAIAILRADYPHLDYTFSFNSEFERWQELDVSMLDILEPHVWMATTGNDRFNERVGYHSRNSTPRVLTTL